jgi:hypothetical protein
VPFSMLSMLGWANKPMRRPVPAHRSPIGVVPASDVFEPFIERSADHWWWGGDFKTFDCDNFAVLRAPREPGSRYNGLYVVVRVLWTRANNASDVAQAVLFNTCGCVTCVNPVHVTRVFRCTRVTLPVNASMNDGVLVTLRQQAQRIHIAPVDVMHAVCGWHLGNHREVPVGTAITCVECVSTWRARGYPFDEAR